MSSSKNSQRALRLMVSLAMLSAVSIVCGKYLAINLGEVLRFSFENLPIIFAGIAFGPLSGLAVGAVADLVGCVLVGYTINPIVTLGAALIGFLSGVSAIACKKLLDRGRIFTVVVSTALAHLVGSVVVKTFGLAKFYEMPFMVLMAWRLLNYAIIGAAEAVLLVYLLRSKAIINAIGKIKSYDK